MDAKNFKEATILVFMELTLQLGLLKSSLNTISSHNPCFYGINFAMRDANDKIALSLKRHNPCFYGINFAIVGERMKAKEFKEPQSLFLWN